MHTFENSSKLFPQLHRDKLHHPPAGKYLLRSYDVLGAIRNEKNCKIQFPPSKSLKCGFVTGGLHDAHSIRDVVPLTSIPVPCCCEQFLQARGGYHLIPGIPGERPLASFPLFFLQGEVEIFAFTCCPSIPKGLIRNNKRALNAFEKMWYIAKEIYDSFFLY